MDNGEAGVPVKALYDYDAAEPDELTFKIGNSQGSFDSVLQFFKSFNSALDPYPVVCIIRNIFFIRILYDRKRRILDFEPLQLEQWTISEEMKSYTQTL